MCLYMTLHANAMGWDEMPSARIHYLVNMGILSLYNQRKFIFLTSCSVTVAEYLETMHNHVT